MKTKTFKQEVVQDLKEMGLIFTIIAILYLQGLGIQMVLDAVGIKV